MNKNKLKRILLLLILTNIVSFVLGFYVLRTGLARKLYDIFEAITNIGDRKTDINLQSVKLDTLYLNFSKKDLKKINSDFNQNYFKIKNFLSPTYNWIGERSWIKTKISFQSNDLKGEVKLIGMRADHFRVEKNISTRVKLKNNQYIYRQKKFNLLNPYSRGYFIDYFYNCLYQKYGGLIIESTPILVQYKENTNFQILESFFSKEMLENQQRREGIIFSADSINEKDKKRYLKLIHPNKLEDLTNTQLNTFNFFSKQYDEKKIMYFIRKDNLALLVALTQIIRTGHHLAPLNLTFYVDPITGLISPFLREVEEFPKKNKPFLKKEEIFTYLGIDSAFLVKNSNFSNEVDNYICKISEIDVDDFIAKNNNLNKLYLASNLYFPWSFNYKNKILVNKILFNKIIKNKIVVPETKSNIIYSGSYFFKDTILSFDESKILKILPGTNIKLKNSILIVNSDIQSIGIKGKEIKIIGDSSSSIIVSNSKIILFHTHFIGFGNKVNNKLRNIDVTAAITFNESDVNMNNCSFSNNSTGDDLLNIYRCNVNIKDITLENARYDALDVDFSRGEIHNLTIKKAGNDGLDFGGSNMTLSQIIIDSCMDKGISIGENSFIKLNYVTISSSEIGLALKDESTLFHDNVNYLNNQIDIVGFSKKGQFGNSQLKFTNNSNLKVKYLIEPGLIIKPEFLSLNRTLNVIDSLYGKKYGKASVR